MGGGSVTAITAIGDGGHTASRRETMTTEYGCVLVVSEEPVLRAGLDLGAFPRHEIEIRGRREMLAIRTLASARDLPTARSTPRHPIEPAAADGELIL
jgi:hypothetical protein